MYKIVTTTDKSIHISITKGDSNLLVFSDKKDSVFETDSITSNISNLEKLGYVKVLKFIDCTKTKDYRNEDISENSVVPVKSSRRKAKR